MKPFSLNAVVVGCGFIGPVHVEALGRSGVRVLGIVGKSESDSRASCERLGLPKVYGSFEDVLADPAVDVVHLATPNRLHFPQATAVLRAGKHVLCEKPLAVSSAEAESLVRLAAETGRAAGVAYNIRFYPLCHEAADHVQGKGFGRLLHAQGSYVQDWLTKPTDFNWRVQAEEGGELRAVADIGTHWLDLVQFVTGEKIVSVMADLRTVHPIRHRPTGGAKTFTEGGGESVSTEPVDVTTDDCGAVMFRFESGANGVLWVSQTTAGRKNRVGFEIAGDSESLAWNSETPNELWVGSRDAASELQTRDPARMGTRAGSLSQYPAGHNEGFPDTFKQLFRTFYGYVAAGDFKAPAPFPTFADGLHEVRLCEAVLQSYRERRWIDVAGTSSGMGM